MCRKGHSVPSGGSRHQQEGETFLAILGGKRGLGFSLSLEWHRTQCKMKTRDPRLESRPKRPANDRCSDTGVSLSSASLFCSCTGGRGASELHIQSPGAEAD